MKPLGDDRLLMQKLDSIGLALMQYVKLKPVRIELVLCRCIYDVDDFFAPMNQHSSEVGVKFENWESEMDVVRNRSGGNGKLLQSRLRIM